MPLDFPDPPRRPRQPKQPKKSSGGGDRRTVGLAIAIYGTAIGIAASVAGAIVYGHLSA
jgi:hypothetical protein